MIVIKLIETGNFTDKKITTSLRSTVYSGRCPTSVWEICCQYRCARYIVLFKNLNSFVFVLIKMLNIND